MDDLISRQAAIDAVCMEWCNIKHQDCKHLTEDSDYDWCDGCETALRTLPSLPPAQLERKKGKWIKRGPSLYTCSECARFSPTQENFCPTCGADNRGEKTDE